MYVDLYISPPTSYLLRSLTHLSDFSSSLWILFKLVFRDSLSLPQYDPVPDSEVRMPTSTLPVLLFKFASPEPSFFHHSIYSIDLQTKLRGPRTLLSENHHLKRTVTQRGFSYGHSSRFEISNQNERVSPA